MPDPAWTLRMPERWCWKPVLREAGMLNLSGESSQGKSPLTIDLCARMWKLPVTDGYGTWPDRQKMQKFPLHWIMLNNEDDLQDTILPRFDLAGGCDLFFHPIAGMWKKTTKTHQRMLAEGRHHAHLRRSTEARAVPRPNHHRPDHQLPREAEDERGGRCPRS